MAVANLERWKSQQIAAAIERGVNALDAAKSLKWFIDHLPVEADPEKYVLPAEMLNENMADRQYIDDARGAFYSDVEPRYARLLDATAID